jgi:hypothetical protein
MDSARAAYRNAVAAMDARPEGYFLWPQMMGALARQIAAAGHAEDAREILGWCRERFPGDASCAEPPAPRSR